MRILYIVNASEFGGTSRHVLWLMEHMVKQGHTVGLVSAPENRLREQVLCLNICFFPNPHFVRDVKLHDDLRALWVVFHAIRTFKPDLVSAHSTKAGFAARIACFALWVKSVVFTAHGWAFTEGRPGWKRYLLALTELVAAKVTTKIICVSHHDRQLALKFRVAKPDQLITIHNGSDPGLFIKSDRRKVREELRLGEAPVITFVGRLSPPKDPLVLLEACNVIGGEFNVLLVGEGELRKPVEQFLDHYGLQDRVFLMGERRDIPEILSASDIFVLVSRWEGLPRAIIEAMMAGLPVVATNVGGIAELVENGVTGYLVPRQDPQSLALSLRRLISDHQLRRRLGDAGRKRALEKFTLERMFAQTQTLYEELLGWVDTN